MRPYRSLQHKTKDRGRFRHIPLDYFEHGVCFSLKHKNKTESQRSFFFPLRKRSFGCFKRLKVTDCLGFYVTKNRPKGRRQGYFVACLQPPPPLRKNRRSGGFFPRERGLLYSIVAVQLKSPLDESFVFITHHSVGSALRKCIKEHAGACVFDYVLKNFSKQMYVQTIQTNTYFV